MDALSRIFAQHASRLERPGERATSETAIIPVFDDAIPGQGFRVFYRAEGIEAHHSDDVGLQAALDVVELLNDDPSFETALEVADAPVFPTRAYLLDISGDRVPAWDLLVRLIDVLGRLRYNQLEIRVGHAFAFTDQDPVWMDASPLTPVQVRRIDSLCAARGIRLVMAEESLTHRARWLEHPQYRERAENPGGFEVDGRLTPPAEFSAAEDNVDLCSDLIRQLSRAAATGSVNIGGHATRELGTGASRDLVNEKGVERVHFDVLMKLRERAAAAGAKHMEMWADTVLQDPALLDELPEDVIPVVRLSADPATGTSFANVGAPLVGSGREFWVAPGTSTWNTFVGRFDQARANIGDAIAWGAVNGADGLVLCGWAGLGHWAPEIIILPHVVATALYAWSGADPAEDVEPAVAAILREDVARTLIRMGHVPTVCPIPLRNSDITWEAVARGGKLPDEWGVGESEIAAARAVLEDAGRELIPDESGPGAVGRASIRLCLDIAGFGLDLVDRVQGRRSDTVDSLAARWEGLVARQRRVWSLTAREGGLEHSLAHLDPVGRIDAAV